MGLMSGNPYYAGNGFAEGLNSFIANMDSGIKSTADLENQRLLRDMQMQESARKQAEADRMDQFRQGATALNADTVKPYYEANTPQAWHAPMVSQDTQSNRLTPYGQQVQTGLMGGVQQEQQLPPTPEEPLYGTSTYDLKLAQVRQGMQARGEDRFKASPTNEQRLALIDSYDPVEGMKQRASMENNDAKLVNLRDMLTLKNDYAIQMSAAKDAADREKIQTKYDNDIALQKEKYDLLKGVKLAGIGANVGGHGAGGNAPTPMTGAPLEGLSAADSAIVRKIANYEMKSPSGMALRTPYWQNIIGRVAVLNPAYDEVQYGTKSAVRKDFTSGKSANNIKSLNTAVAHLDSLQKAFDALDNTSVPGYNLVQNKAYAAAGDGRIRAVTTAATATESELASVFKGMGATDQEIKAWRANFSENSSPKQQKAAINQAVDLLGGRLSAMHSQYEQGMGAPLDFNILNGKSREVLKRYGMDVDKLDPVKGASPAAKAAQNPAPSDTGSMTALPPASSAKGRMVMGSDGIKRQSDGKKWNLVR